MRFPIPAVVILFCSLALGQASMPVEVQEVVKPQRLAWNTNSSVFTIHNTGTTERRVIIDIQSRVDGSGGVGWQTSEVIASGERKRIQRKFFVRPLPGRAHVRVTVADAATGQVLFKKDVDDDFPVENPRRNPVEIDNPDIWRLNDPSIAPTQRSYPPLELRHERRFAFYFVANDRYASLMLPDIARRRAAVVARLEKLLKTRLDHEIAFYFFPDAPTKFAYTLHRGDGWAVNGRAILEILNDRKQLDPNHELVHIVAAQLGDPPALLNEGLATYLQEQHKWEGYGVNCWCQSFSQHHMLLDIAQLLRRDEIGSDESHPAVAYPEAASFVGFLVERYGWPRFRTAYASLKRSDNESVQERNQRNLERTYNHPLAQLEAEWLRSYLGSSPCTQWPAQDRLDKINRTLR